MHLCAHTRRPAVISAALFAGALATCAPAPDTQANRSPAVSPPAQIRIESLFCMLPRDALVTLAAKLPAIKLPPEDGFSVSLLDNHDLSKFLRAFSTIPIPDTLSISEPRDTLVEGTTISRPLIQTTNYITSFYDPNKPARIDTIHTGFTETLTPTFSYDRRFKNIRFSLAANLPSDIGTLSPNSPKEIHGTLALPLSGYESAAISGFSIIDAKGKAHTSVLLMHLQTVAPRPNVPTTQPGA